MNAGNLHQQGLTVLQNETQFNCSARSGSGCLEDAAFGRCCVRRMLPGVTRGTLCVECVDASLSRSLFSPCHHQHEASPSAYITPSKIAWCANQSVASQLHVCHGATLTRRSTWRAAAGRHTTPRRAAHDATLVSVDQWRIRAPLRVIE